MTWPPGLVVSVSDYSPPKILWLCLHSLVCNIEVKTFGWHIQKSGVAVLKHI